MIQWIKGRLQGKGKKITWSSLKNFFIAKTRDKEDPFVDRQANWRSEQILNNSPECLEMGYCKDCLCDFPDKLYEPEACKLGCYPEWMDEETFNKKIYG